MSNDTVRVLRIVEYVGPREWVKETVGRSIQGERRVGLAEHHTGVIRAATIGRYPEILGEKDIQPPAEDPTP